MLKSMLKSIWHRLPIYYQTRLRRPGVFRQARFFEEASHWPLERRQAYQLLV